MKQVSADANEPVWSAASRLMHHACTVVHAVVQAIGQSNAISQILTSYISVTDQSILMKLET